MRLLIISAVLLVLCSCSTNQEPTVESPEPGPETESKLTNGNWLGKLLLPDGYYIPFNFEVNSNTVTIQNSSERINTTLAEKEDSLYFKMPPFDSEFKFVVTDGKLTGYWINNAKKNYSCLLYTSDAADD